MRVAISWNGLPQYAARLIRGAVDAMPQHDWTVIGTRPRVPIAGMEAALGRPITWLEDDRETSWNALGLEPPEVFVQSGWGYPPFNSLGREARAAGARIIGMSDANWRGDFRQQVLGPVAFRLRKRRLFDAMLVAGVEGRRLMRHFGFPDRLIAEGMYGADPALFSAGLPLPSRPKQFLFVGQFIPRKDVTGLAEAFVRFHADHPGWTLRLVGSGEQRDLLPVHSAIVVEDFVQPESLSERFHAARFFVLPSLSEAWGLVVHEATASGCGLVLSDRIGSAPDLATPVNAVTFAAGNKDDLTRALTRAAAFSDAQLDAAQSVSLERAGRFGPRRYAAALSDLIEATT